VVVKKGMDTNSVDTTIKMVLSSPFFLKKMDRKGGEGGQQTQIEDPHSEVEMVSRQSE
jgi:hypothetical protein